MHIHTRTYIAQERSLPHNEDNSLHDQYHMLSSNHSNSNNVKVIPTILIHMYIHCTRVKGFLSPLSHKINCMIKTTFLSVTTATESDTHTICHFWSAPEGCVGTATEPAHALIGPFNLLGEVLSDFLLIQVS